MIKSTGKILVIGDNISLQTGQGYISKHIVSHLINKGHEILYIQLQQDSNNSKDNDIICTENMLYNSKNVEKVVEEHDDIKLIITIADIWKVWYAIGVAVVNKIPIVSHLTVDTEPYPKFYRVDRDKIIDLHEVLRNITKIIPVTEFGMDAIRSISKDNCTNYIPHGIDLDTFDRRSVDGEVKKSIREKLGCRKEVFAVSVCKNFARKRIDLMLKGLETYIRNFNDNIHLYIHTQPWTNTGWNLYYLSEYYGIEKHVSFNEKRVGWNLNEMCDLYNVADLYLNTSAGEGFCLPIAEAAACGCPSVYHDCAGMTYHSKYSTVGAGVSTLSYYWDHHMNSKMALVDTNKMAISMEKIIELGEVGRDIAYSNRDIYNKSDMCESIYNEIKEYIE